MTPAIARGGVDQPPVCVVPDPTFTVASGDAARTSYTGFCNRIVIAIGGLGSGDGRSDVEAMDVDALHPDELRALRDALDEAGPRLTLDELRRSLDAG